MEYPKLVRIEDKELCDKMRGIGHCMVKIGGCSGGLDLHHIDSRGSGGGDVEGNLIILCRKHHNEAHAGKIGKEELRKAVKYDKYFWGW